MNVNKWRILAFTVLYYFVSVILLAVTAGGWSLVFVPIMFSFFFYWPFGISLIAAILLMDMRAQMQAYIPRLPLVGIFIAQIGILLLNSNDCGDGDGHPFLFYQRLLGASCDGVQNISGAMHTFANMFAILYIAGLQLLLLHMARSPKEFRNNMPGGWKRAAFYFLWAVIIVSTLFPYIIFLD